MISLVQVASIPSSPPRAQVYSVTFDPHEKSGGEPGEFYHVSDVKGKERTRISLCTDLLDAHEIKIAGLPQV